MFNHNMNDYFLKDKEVSKTSLQLFNSKIHEILNKNLKNNKIELINFIKYN